MTVRFDLPRGKQLEAFIARASLTHPQVLRTILTEETAKRRKVLPLPATSLDDAIRQVVATYPKARLLTDSIRVIIRRGQRSAHLLRPVAVQAWHEAFGLPIPSLEVLPKRPELSHPEGDRVGPSQGPDEAENVPPKPTDFAGFLDRLKG